MVSRYPFEASQGNRFMRRHNPFFILKIYTPKKIGKPHGEICRRLLTVY